MKIAPGSFGSRSGRSWSAQYATEESRSADQKIAVAGGVDDPQGLLTPEVLRKFIEAHTCPWCGAGPFKVLAAHTSSAHGITGAELREAADLSANAKIADPSYSQKLAKINGDRLRGMSSRAAAAAREKYGEDGLLALRKIGISKAAEQKRRHIAEEIINAFDQGLTLDEICDQFGTSGVRVKRILSDVGRDVGDLRSSRGPSIRGSDHIKPAQEGWARTSSRSRQEFISKFNQAVDSPEKIRALADEYGTTQKSLLHRAKKYGLEAPDLRGKTKAFREAIDKRRVGSPPCRVDGCDRISVARKMCDLHYRRALAKERAK